MRQLAAGAIAVGEVPEHECFLVVLADDPTDPSYTWELQVGLAYDEQDRSLGQDTYSITVDGGPTVYGGVRSCRMTADRLQLSLRREAATELGVDQDVEFLLRPDAADQLEDLRRGLRRVFDPALPDAPELALS